MRNIEFFTDGNGRDLIVNIDGNYQVLTEDDHEVIELMYDIIQSDYTEAFNALKKIYNSRKDFKYLIVRRFLKCNFAVHDEKPDVRPDRSFQLEFVSCPMRGECTVEGIVCQAKLNNELSDREIEIVRLIADGLSNEEISNEIHRSPFTIKNHRSNIRRKTGCNNTAALLNWAADKKII